MIFAAGVGIPLGRYAARHAQGWSDGAVTVVSLLGISIPVFVLGLTLQYIFAVQLDLLPAAGPDRPAREPRDQVELRAHRHACSMGRPDLFLDGLSAPDPAGHRAGLDPARDHLAGSPARPSST